ncbi:MAG: amino acid permease [Aeriscardovia sp.]|nr:amino acid permease [Aeriscardovia sp.]
MEDTQKKSVSVPGLIALIVSASIGAGIFNLQGEMATNSAVGPAILGWIVCLIGVTALVLAINNLLVKRPELDAGIFSYAKEACGPLGGFISGWGYWLSAWIGNIAFGTMLMGTFGSFIPFFGSGSNWPSVVVAACVVWILTLIVNHGFESATVLNTVVTICKLIPIFVFMIVVIISFKAGVFTADFWGNLAANVSHGVKPSDVWTQMSGTITNIMWVFVGIEGASIISKQAKSTKDAGRATIWGLVVLSIIYIWASILPYGVLPQGVIADMSAKGTDGTTMAAIMESAVGPWAYWLVTVGVIISVLGSWLSWTILPAETTALMANSEHTLTKGWGTVNKHNSPQSSLIIAAILQTLFLLCLPFFSEAYTFTSQLATVAVLVSYMFVGFDEIKVGAQERSAWNIIVGIICSAFFIFALYESGWSDILLLCIAMFVGFFFYVPAARKDHKIGAWEWIVMGILTLAAIAAVILLCMGIITIG